MDGEGFFINLDRSTDRRVAMEQQLAAPGFAGRYERFPALSADVAEAQTRGLRTAGELGIWRSTLAVLERIIHCGDQPELWHLCEDDVELNPMLPLWLERLAVSAQVGWDALFTDSYVVPVVYRQAIALLRSRNDRDDLRLVGNPFYRAGLTSYVMRPEGAKSIHEALTEVYRSGVRLVPVDLALRGLIEGGRISVAVTLPFLSSPSLARSSTIQIQEGGDSLRRRSVYMDLFIRRALYVSELDCSVDQGIYDMFYEHLLKDYALEERQEIIVSVVELLQNRGYKLVY
jgi:hypothetical protein